MILIPDNDFDAVDLAFMDKFLEMEKQKDTNGVDPEGVEEARDHQQNQDQHDQLPENAEVIQVEWDAQTSDAGESEEEAVEAEGQGEGEQDSETEGDGDSDSENDGEGESSECEGDCSENQGDDDAPPCPYCTEKEKRQQENLLPENVDLEGDPIHIALDFEGQEIYVGSEIVSSADGDHVGWTDDPEYVGVVMGRAYGYEGDIPARAMIVVLRRDKAQEEFQGCFMVSGETDTKGWGVRSDLTAVVAEEKPEPDPPPEPEEKSPILHDENGTPLYDHDQILVTGKNRYRFPVEGIATLHAACDKNDYGVTYPCFAPDNWELDKLTLQWTLKGKRVFTFSTPSLDPLDTITGIQKLERKDEEPEQEQDHEYDFDSEEEEKPRKPMTKAQMEKFRKLCAEIFVNSHSAFGRCNVRVNHRDEGPELPGGIFDGEEVGRTLELTSGKVTYRVTFSAERCD